MPGSELHCASYYAATTNQTVAFPVLQGDVRADVCIVGGGFTGVATALTLAERGYKVVVTEQNCIGWGASGRNGGQMIGGIGGGESTVLKHHGEGIAKDLFQMGYRGHEIIEQRIKHYKIDCDLKYGYMDVAHKSRHLRTLDEWQAELNDYGMADHLRRVSGDEMREVLGTDAYKGGLINNRNGHLHPLNLCLGEARAAAELGVQFFENSHVTEIIHGDKPKVISEKGTVTADFVVLAGNAYTHLEDKTLSGMVFPAGTYIIATEPLSEKEVAEINPLDMAVCDMNTVLDYYRLSADRRMLFGGRCDYSGRVPANIKDSIFPRMTKIFPQLANKRIDYQWGGNVGIVLNRVPMLGRSSKNVFYSIGYSGHGVNMTHLAGEIMADAVSGTFERMDIFANIKHQKIPLGRKLGSNMVALGMLYYKMRDLL
ncbi:MAG: gamma-glutamylputrescine oxidase [Patiriisocius sp.]|jgi:gamma-glutamylputrescine oxidase